MFDTRIRAADHEAKRRAHAAVQGDDGVAANDQDSVKNPLAALDAFLARASFDASDPAALGGILRQMVDARLDRLPLPGSGQTLARWRALAAVAARDLGLVKLFEGHTDALAILAELGAVAVPAGSRWGVWAAEAPDARVLATPLADGELRLAGTKAWCSGAAAVTHALVTAWVGDAPVLAALALDQPSVSIDTHHWHAVGMQATASGDVTFDGTRAVQLGIPHGYVRRPGFWQGGAGIAACWYGAAAGLASMMAEAVAARPDAHRLAHMGAVEVALAGAAAVLHETAAQIDAHPAEDMQSATLRARLVVEAAAAAVVEHAGRALGAAPLCRNERFARAMADLPVFLRQSHAERDLAALAERSLGQRRDHGDPWLL
ncbi:acyl-CoA dehydrogenase family protein [Paraburkholderia sp. BCC1885]|uniref:acyl-CoA dehydrogenase family protein n=1 Tax=Paraburkholderia sp. BCC1885 TaxID=2562669 RepID=UPI0021B22086|nr:acyl-CoA dehydrogenase family protein [Paraburkholderia sp. BCC1885]